MMAEDDTQNTAPFPSNNPPPAQAPQESFAQQPPQTSMPSEAGPIQPDVSRMGLPSPSRPAAPVPPEQQGHVGSGLSDFAQHKDALDAQEARRLVDAVPKDVKDPTVRFAAAFGNAREDQQGPLLQYGTKQFDEGMAGARAAMDKGEPKVAATLATAAHTHIVDGNIVSFTPTDDRMVVGIKNLAGGKDSTIALSHQQFATWLDDSQNHSSHAQYIKPGNFIDTLKAAEKASPGGATPQPPFEGAGGPKRDANVPTPEAVTQGPNGETMRTPIDATRDENNVMHAKPESVSYAPPAEPAPRPAGGIYSMPGGGKTAYGGPAPDFHGGVNASGQQKVDIAHGHDQARMHDAEIRANIRKGVAPSELAVRMYDAQMREAAQRGHEYTDEEKDDMLDRAYENVSRLVEREKGGAGAPQQKPAQHGGGGIRYDSEGKAYTRGPDGKPVPVSADHARQ
jgi:hypothetical protein